MSETESQLHPLIKRRCLHDVITVETYSYGFHVASSVSLQVPLKPSLGVYVELHPLFQRKCL